VVLLPVESPEAIAATLDAVDGLVLTGGMDVDPRHYGEPVLNDTVKPEPDRDAFELPLVREAMARDLPVLAICRGCQVLNVATGGSLWQDLPAQRPAQVTHRQSAPRDAVTHAVHIAAGSLLAGVIGEVAGPLETNTFHHQAANAVPDGLRAVAFAADGTIEGLESPDHTFVVGVQWHPEHLAPSRPEHARLFEALVAAARGASLRAAAAAPSTEKVTATPNGGAPLAGSGAVAERLRRTA
jgi:putative glutamine amidotransferase